MKKLIYILPLLLLIPGIMLSQGGYTLNNAGGQLNNLGTIKVKSGQVNELPDTLGGRIEFLYKRAKGQQVVPNIVYTQLVIKNKALKIIGDSEKDEGGATRNMTVMDSLIIDDSTEFTSFWLGLQPENVHAQSSVTNNAKFKGRKFLVLKNDSVEQDLIGKGQFSNLAIDNPKGVNVKLGGFIVEDSLQLIRGELRNSAENNFIAADSLHITRNVGASLAIKPAFEGKVEIKYRGEGSLATGGEIPDADDAIISLANETSEGLTLSQSVQVNDSLYTNSVISTNQDTLTLATANNPVYGENPDSEVAGFLKRTVLYSQDTLLLNNPYTYAIFESNEDMQGATEFIAEVRPAIFPTQNDGEDKVQRQINVYTNDASGNAVEAPEYGFGYGWRYAPGEAYDEMHILTFEDVLLQNWLQNNSWFDLKSEEENKWDEARGWAYNFNRDNSYTGNFAIGMPAFGFISFLGKVILEGPYNQITNQMNTDLLARGWLNAPPDKSEYPLNLVSDYDPERFKSVPDSVVDWIVMEFRKERFSNERFYKTGFVRYDGMIVDQKGNEEIRLTKSDGIDSGGGNYYVVVRHRNHNTIITAQTLNLKPIKNGQFFDFSRPSLLEGGTSAMRLVDVNEGGERVFGMRAGYDIPNYSEVRVQQQLNVDNFFTVYEDHRAAWQMFTFEGYLPQDYNLDGIVNTRDFNTSWNNRNK